VMVMVVMKVMVMVVMEEMVMAVVWTASFVWMVNLADSAEVKEVDGLVVMLVPQEDNVARVLLAMA